MKRRSFVFSACAALLLPQTLSAKSKVVQADIDDDGDPDAGVGIRISVFKDRQIMRVISSGRVDVWPVSTGRAHHGTPTGVFTPCKMEKMHYSSKYPEHRKKGTHGASMPYCIFITEDDYRIHAADEGGEENLRSPVSHGCVRLSMKHAKQLYELVEFYGLQNTRIYIYDRMFKV